MEPAVSTPLPLRFFGVFTGWEFVDINIASRIGLVNAVEMFQKHKGTLI